MGYRRQGGTPPSESVSTQNSDAKITVSGKRAEIIHATSLPKTASFTTGSQVESAARVMIDKIEALDQEHQYYPMIAHTLSVSVALDGVLSLDFPRDYDLHINFKTGEITLT